MYEYQQPYGDKPYTNTHSTGMAIASLVLGIMGVVLGCCIYPGFIFGSLAVILALLSRGGERNLNSFAIAGLVLGIVGIAIGIFMVLYSMITFFIAFGGWEGYINEIQRAIEQMPTDEYPNWYHTY